MRIAIASQDRRTVTGHAGKCRRFWIYDVEAGREIGKTLLELPTDQTFHASHDQGAHPLADVQVLISGGMGQGLVRRLATLDILGLVTTETDPDRALDAYLDGTLPLGTPDDHGAHGHHHHADAARPGRAVHVGIGCIDLPPHSK